MSWTTWILILAFAPAALAAAVVVITLWCFAYAAPFLSGYGAMQQIRAACGLTWKTRALGLTITAVVFAVSLIAILASGLLLGLAMFSAPDGPTAYTAWYIGGSAFLAMVGRAAARGWHGVASRNYSDSSAKLSGR